MHPSNFPATINDVSIIEKEMKLCEELWKILRLSNLNNEKIPTKCVFDCMKVILDLSINSELASIHLD